MNEVVVVIIAAALLRAISTNMAVAGAGIDVLEKRISCLERRVLTSEEDVQGLKGSSVVKSYLFFDSVKPKEFKRTIQT